jgi:DNA-3-methyladenine glycosylase
VEEIAKMKRPDCAKLKLPGRLLRRTFFEDSPELVAPRLLGKVLVHKSAAGVLAGSIVEVEAYLGPHNNPPDPAAHAHGGPTPRNLVLFGPPAHAYVYAIYGRYFCMNITCEVEGKAGCVLLRAVEPMVGRARMAANRGLAADAPASLIASGPGRLCMAMGLTRSAHNGLNVTSATSALQVRDGGERVLEVVTTVRIGIRHAVDWPLRFALRGHRCVSGPRRMLEVATVVTGSPSVK